MTTAFILALIAAAGVTVVLIAAIYYARRLERDNARLMRIIGELNEEQAKLCKERDEARDEAEHYRLLSDYAQAQLRARDVWCSNGVTPARESVKIPSRWEERQ